MARVLLLGCVALMESACLLPQDDTVLPDLPPKKNSPLRILAQTVQPAQRKTPIVVGTPSPTCPRTEFSLIVADEDLGDPTRSQWYVDPNQNYEPGATSPVFNGNPILISTTVNRTLTAPPAMLTYLQGLSNAQEHVIEVWVTDGDFVPGPPTGTTRPDRTLPDGTVVKDEAFTDAHVWIVTRVETCP